VHNECNLITNNVLKHIDNGHNPNTYSKQLKYRSKESVLKDLANKSNL
jgi:hypothetical protein